jgi:hypothetical protein
MLNHAEISPVESPNGECQEQALRAERRNSGPPAPENASDGERRMTLAIKTAKGSAEAAKVELDAMEAESARATRILLLTLIAAAFIICGFAIKIPVVG